jgi:hypothetical protein
MPTKWQLLMILWISCDNLITQLSLLSRTMTHFTVMLRAIAEGLPVAYHLRGFHAIFGGNPCLKRCLAGFFRHPLPGLLNFAYFRTFRLFHTELH